MASEEVEYGTHNHDCKLDSDHELDHDRVSVMYACVITVDCDRVHM